MFIDRVAYADHGRAEFAAFGHFRLFPRARLLERDGIRVVLGGRALDVLLELVRQAGKVISKTDLISSVWQDTAVVEGVVRTHVYNLRKALGDSASGARYITAVAGRGYCFIAPVVFHSIARASGLKSASAGSARQLHLRATRSPE